MDDYRQAAINAICQNWCGTSNADCKNPFNPEKDEYYHCDGCGDVELIKALPSAQPEVRPIDYQDCSNAMLKMWMDNVVTDGEYNRIMDKLNAHWEKKDG